VTANVTVTNAGAASSVYLGPAQVAHPATATINFNANDNTAYGSTIAIDTVAGHNERHLYGGERHDGSDRRCHRLLQPRYRRGHLPRHHSYSASGHFAPATASQGQAKANVPITFKLWNRGVPTTAKAVTGNLTVVNSTATVRSTSEPNPLTSPTTSTINFAKGQIRANSMTVPLSSTGTLLATFLAPNGYKIDLVFDVTGYYTADLSGDRWVPMTTWPPAAQLDTRTGHGRRASSSPTCRGPSSFPMASRSRPTPPASPAS